MKSNVGELVQLPYLTYKKTQAQKGSRYPYVCRHSFLGLCLKIYKSTSLRPRVHLYWCLLSSCSWVSDFQTFSSLPSKVWLKYLLLFWVLFCFSWPLLGWASTWKYFQKALPSTGASHACWGCVNETFYG